PAPRPHTGGPAAHTAEQESHLPRSLESIEVGLDQVHADGVHGHPSQPIHDRYRVPEIRVQDEGHLVRRSGFAELLERFLEASPVARLDPEEAETRLLPLNA